MFDHGFRGTSRDPESVGTVLGSLCYAQRNPLSYGVWFVSLDSSPHYCLHSSAFCFAWYSTLFDRWRPNLKRKNANADTAPPPDHRKGEIRAVDVPRTGTIWYNIVACVVTCGLSDVSCVAVKNLRVFDRRRDGGMRVARRTATAGSSRPFPASGCPQTAILPQPPTQPFRLFSHRCNR